MRNIANINYRNPVCNGLFSSAYNKNQLFLSITPGAKQLTNYKMEITDSTGTIHIDDLNVHSESLDEGIINYLVPESYYNNNGNMKVRLLSDEENSPYIVFDIIAFRDDDNVSCVYSNDRYVMSIKSIELDIYSIFKQRTKNVPALVYELTPEHIQILPNTTYKFLAYLPRVLIEERLMPLQENYKRRYALIMKKTDNNNTDNCSKLNFRLYPNTAISIQYDIARTWGNTKGASSYIKIDDDFNLKQFARGHMEVEIVNGNWYTDLQGLYLYVYDELI